MSRGGRDDDRADVRETDVGRTPPERSFSRERPEPNENVLTHGLTLPRGDERERVDFRDRNYTLNGSETRALAAVGAFRVVDSADFKVDEHGRNGFAGDWRHLREAGLVTQTTTTDREGAHHVVSLTRDGKDLLDAHMTTSSGGRRQVFYAGVVKPRELAHDARLYGVFREESRQIEREGGRVTRVVLDYEVKRDYQQFLNRKDRPADADVSDDRLAFAQAHDLKVVKGHLELPDLRIEYETEDGRLEYRDVELVTEHYSRGQVSGKTRAGFTCYRTGGSGGQSRTGGSPFDPRHLERLS
jgi:hypothetical protein